MIWDLLLLQLLLLHNPCGCWCLLNLVCSVRGSCDDYYTVFEAVYLKVDYTCDDIFSSCFYTLHHFQETFLQKYSFFVRIDINMNYS